MSWGEKLRSALDRLRGSRVDKETVKEAIKDIQRALIGADVEISTVLHLSKQIEEQAFGDLPEGVSRQEHVVKVTYDALSEILGGTGLPIPERPNRILLLGLFGQGKCVHPDTIIPTPDGDVKKIKEIYDETSGTEQVLEDGFVKKTNFDVFSFDPTTLKMINAESSLIWKLKKTQPLIKIKLDNGNHHKVSVTPEHPFFILDNGIVREVRADDLRIGQFVATPKRLPFIQKEHNWTKQIITYQKYRFCSTELAKKVKSTILENHQTLINWYNLKKRNFSYCAFTGDLKKNIVRSEIIEDLGIEYQTQKILVYPKGRGGQPVHFPCDLNTELAQLLGYVAGDGHIEHNYIQIANENPEIVERIRLLAKNLFGLEAKVKRDPRSSCLFDIRLNSVTLSELIQKIFMIPAGKKSDVMRLPKEFFTCTQTIKNSFIQAYFDCDGSIALDERVIEFSTASKNFAHDFRNLLISLDYYPSFSRKLIKGKFYYLVKLRSKNVEKFFTEVGSVVPFKKIRLEKCIQIGKRQSFGKTELIPVGSLCHDIRERLGISIGEIQEKVNSYGQLEKSGLITRQSISKFLNAIKTTKNNNNQILELVKNGSNYRTIRGELNANKGWLNACLHQLKKESLIGMEGENYYITNSGLLQLQKSSSYPEEPINTLKMLVESDIIWLKVKSIEEDQSTEYVYDLTVEDYHNFVANEIIVHNTTSAGKIAKYYAKRGLSVGLIAADVFRPAAADQLEQLAQKIGVPVFQMKGETKAEKIVRQGLDHFKGKDLVIVDSAGRSGLDEELSNEIQAIQKELQAPHVWLVMGADVGQLAKKQATAFHESVGVNGIILTRTDGSAKGGGALAACHATNAQVLFLGTGEKVEDLEVFDATRYLSRVMGYGDLQSLLEKIQDVSGEEQLSPEEMFEREFTLKTFYEQLKAARKMGPLGKVMELMGMSAKMPKEVLETGEKKMDGFKHLMDSMTIYEKDHPDVINHPRMVRIAKGSGHSEGEVRELLKQYKQMKDMLKEFKKMKDVSSAEDLQKSGGMQKLFSKMNRKQQKKKVKIR